MSGLVKLKSQSDELVSVDVEVAKMSNLLGNMLSDNAADMDEPIPVPNVKTAILQKVMDYCKHHKENRSTDEISKPLRSNNLLECGVSEWDNNFISMEQEQLFEVILAANYLDIKTLLDLACAKVAAMIKGKTPEEIRSQFGIVNDFTPEEEAQIMEENKCFEDA